MTLRCGCGFCGFFAMSTGIRRPGSCPQPPRIDHGRAAPAGTVKAESVGDEVEGIRWVNINRWSRCDPRTEN